MARTASSRKVHTITAPLALRDQIIGPILTQTLVGHLDIATA
jgi:hypothetical protein